MPAIWSQAFSFTLLCLNFTRLAALNTRSILSDIDEALKVFEGVAVDVVSQALDGNGGVLAQFTMNYNPYAEIL